MECDRLNYRRDLLILLLNSGAGIQRLSTNTYRINNCMLSILPVSQWRGNEVVDSSRELHLFVPESLDRSYQAVINPRMCNVFLYI